MIKFQFNYSILQHGIIIFKYTYQNKLNLITSRVIKSNYVFYFVWINITQQNVCI